jgi:hypothetical protein
MSSNEGLAQTERSNTVHQFPAWARLTARVVLVVLVVFVLVAVFFAGGWYNGGGLREREDILVPVPEEAPCSEYYCHPMGRGGQQCYQRIVPCP